MKRLLTAVLLLPPVIYLVLAAHPLVFLAAVTAVGLACYHEFTRLARGHRIEMGGPLGYAAGALAITVPAAGLAWFTAVPLAALIRSLRAADLSKALPEAAALTLGVAYTCLPWRCAALLREINPHWLLYALALSWAGDVAAYYVGSLAGRHKLAPRISPAKSWEGSVAGLAGSVLFGVLYLGWFLPQADTVEVIGLTAAAAAAGQLGDLCESAMKRGAGVKDSGAMLPGHGGWLDRLDSCLFAAPVVYLWLSRGSIGG